MRRLGGGDAQDETGGRDDTVISAEHCCAQPAYAMRAVPLAMTFTN